MRFSYPKPLALDMKWENHDINVAERAKIRKFSELDDIVTSLTLLKLLFDNALVYDNLLHRVYSNREKADISFEITKEKLCLFLRMLLLCGWHKLPDNKMHWETTPNTCVSLI